MQNKSELVETRRGEFMSHANFCDALSMTLEERTDKAALSEMAERWREFAQDGPMLDAACRKSN